MIRGIFREKTSDETGAMEDFNRGIAILELLSRENALQDRESASKAYVIRGKLKGKTGDSAGATKDFANASEIFSEEKSMAEKPDQETIKEIISSAIARAMNSKVEKILDVRPKKTISSEEFHAFSPRTTKESLVAALLEDHRVTSAEYGSGQIHFKAMGQKVSFKFKFQDEMESGSA